MDDVSFTVHEGEIFGILGPNGAGKTTAVAATAPAVGSANVAGTIAFFPMMFFAGVRTPVQAMPDALRRVVEYFPFGAASQALHQAADGAWPGWVHLGVIAAWSAVLVAAAVRWFRWE